MAPRKKQQPRVQVNELSREVEDLTPEQAESVQGGIIAILIGLRSDSQPTQQEPDIIVGAGAGAPGGHTK